MASSLDIYSMASIHLGNGVQASETADNAFMNPARDIYASIRDARLSSSRWGFALKKATLSKLSHTPLNEYQYAYQIPPEVLIIYHLYPNVGFAIYGDEIYSNTDALQIDYVYDPGSYPSYFAEALSYDLAARLAYQVTKDAKLGPNLLVAAGRAWSSPFTTDAQQHPTRAIVDQPLIWARNA